MSVKAEADFELVVRRCRSTDVQRIESREPPGRHYASATFARQEAGQCAYLLALVGGEPVGSGELEFGAPPELKNLHVATELRGRGIGGALVRAAEVESISAGTIRIGVAEDNHGASRLYLRLGYRPTGESVTYAYDYIDDDGVSRHAIETSTFLEKSLANAWRDVP